MSKIHIDRFLAMITHKRPHSSTTEELFTKKYLDGYKGMRSDAFGNRILDIGKNPTTLFSAHVDTVHRTHGMQNVVVDTTQNIVYKDDHECLGADDAAGMIVLMHMIDHKIPGRYVFHRGEERGRLGSTWIVKNTPELLTGIQRAIAFDRRGTQSIITFQSSQRCCSDDFSTALAKEFAKSKMTFVHDTTGSFTDTFSYMSIVPECTNVSIGYYNEHSGQEMQDLNHLANMLKATIAIDWHTLPSIRDHTVVERKVYKPFTYGSYQDSLDYEGIGAKADDTPSWKNGRKNPKFLDTTMLPWDQLLDVVLSNPIAIADLLYDYKTTLGDLAEYTTEDEDITIGPLPRKKALQ